MPPKVNEQIIRTHDESQKAFESTGIKTKIGGLFPNSHAKEAGKNLSIRLLNNRPYEGSETPFQVLYQLLCHKTGTDKSSVIFISCGSVVNFAPDAIKPVTEYEVYLWPINDKSCSKVRQIIKPFAEAQEDGNDLTAAQVTELNEELGALKLPAYYALLNCVAILWTIEAADVMGSANTIFPEMFGHIYINNKINISKFAGEPVDSAKTVLTITSNKKIKDSYEANSRSEAEKLLLANGSLNTTIFTTVGFLNPHLFVANKPPILKPFGKVDPPTTTITSHPQVAASASQNQQHQQQQQGGQQNNHQQYQHNSSNYRGGRGGGRGGRGGFNHHTGHGRGYGRGGRGGGRGFGGGNNSSNFAGGNNNLQQQPPQNQQPQYNHPTNYQAAISPPYQNMSLPAAPPAWQQNNQGGANYQGHYNQGGNANQQQYPNFQQPQNYQGNQGNQQQPPNQQQHNIPQGWYNRP